MSQELMGARRGARPMSNSMLLRLAGAVAIAGGLALAPTLASASSGGRIAITGFSASSRNLQPVGGRITLTAVVTNAATCTFSVSPSVASFPQTLSCANASGKSNRTLHVATILPSNAKSAAIHYNWSLLAKPQGSSAPVKKSIKVTVDGYSWGAVQQTLATQSLVAGLSCPTTSMCVMVASGGYAGTLTSTGSHWQKVDNSTGLLSVSCAPGTPVFCVAGDIAGNYLVLSGTTWSSPAAMPGAPGTGGTPDKVGKLGWTDCIRNAPKSSAKTCLLGDDTGHTYLLSLAQTITVRPERHDVERVAGVSCTSPTACVAVAQNGDAIFFDGTSWSAPHSLDAFGGVTGVSCALNGTCLLVDNTGSVVTFPSSGSSATNTHNRHGVNIQGTSCVDGYCLVATANGSFYQVVGSAWARSPKSYINLYGAVVVGVSCARDRASPKLLLSCTSIIQAQASGKKGKDFKGHVTLMK